MLLKLGSRSSALAKIQTYSVAKALQEISPTLEIQFHFKESQGDKDLTSPLWSISGQGIFTKDLQEDLLDHKIDAIVHSWKDLDLTDRMGTSVVSVLPREDQRDIIFFKKNSKNKNLDSLKVLTSSPRREYNISPFIKSFFPSSLSELPIHYDSIRGNVQTRFRKFIESDADCLLVAKAAIDRLLLANHSTDEIPDLRSIQADLRSQIESCHFMIIPLSQNPCAPAQGSLCVEVRENDKDLLSLFKKITDSNTESASLQERSILRQYGGGCHQKIGISVIKREFGEILYLKGKTDSGVVLNEISFSEKLELQFEETEVWPFMAQKPKKDRVHLTVDLPVNVDLYISKSYSLPDYMLSSLDDRILWCSGISTWKELAKRDIWIHGSSDGLGEGEKIHLESLIQRKADFIKLTHDLKQNKNLPTLKTYIVSSPDIPLSIHPKQIKAAYWNSGSEFMHMMEKFPEWKMIMHFCGPGSTHERIKQYLGEEGKVYICPSFQFWKDNYIKN